MATSLGRQPAAPLPLAVAEGGDVVHALRLREGHGIAALQRDHVLALQREERSVRIVRLVHGGGGN
jgi:hypothetical protein